MTTIYSSMYPSWPDWLTTSNLTLREISSVSLDNLLGFLAPITIRFKVPFQKLCHSKLEWDSPLPEHLVNEWRVLVSDLGEGVSISVPRNYFDGLDGGPSSITLCGFCDASKHAYAAVVYLKVSTEAGTVIRFVVSKTRVAPLQLQTIP